MGLWIPKTARRKQYVCGLCTTRFPKEQQRQFIDHVGRCSAYYEGEIQELTAIKESSGFTSVLDKEQQAWHREVRAGVRNPKSKGVIVNPIRT